MTIRRFILVALMLAGPMGCDRAERAAPDRTPVPVERTLQAIIAEGDDAAFQSWLEKAIDANERDPRGQTPLLTAIAHGQGVFVADLLERGADANLIDARGASPLHVAAQYGRADLIALLLDAGADPTGTNSEGLSAYDLAILQGQSEVAAALAEARSIYLSIIKGEPPPPELEPPTIPPALLLSTDFRTWTSITGTRMEAAFIQNIFDTVILQNRDGEMFRIALNRLAPADQTVIRQLSGLDPHALAAARSRTITAPRQRDSLSLRIGKDKGWTVLEDCRLIKRSGNDGDSFHVRHDGKEYIFRLYFVDAAETSLSFPQRVRDQEKYFGLNTSDTLKLAKEASNFAISLLASGPFTVVTQWEDARGNSRLPRHYALVVTSAGDLDDLLTREGLVRQFGMPIRTSLGQRKQAQLRKLEQEAKQQRAGAWAKSDDRKARQ